MNYEKMIADRAKRVKAPAIVVGPPPGIGGPQPDGKVMEFDETGRAIPPASSGPVKSQMELSCILMVESNTRMAVYVILTVS